MGDSAIRGESAELRSRCGRLRDHSRNLRARSQECRIRLTRAAEGIVNAAAVLATGVDAGGSEQMKRLFRAETDLQTAIAECTAALAAVRHELRFRDHAPAIVH